MADEPEAQGGADTGPSPYDYLLVALGSGTSMTIALYARRKQWPLGGVTVKLERARRLDDGFPHGLYWPRWSRFAYRGI
jgi:putative redox protein